MSDQSSSPQGSTAGGITKDDPGPLRPRTQELPTHISAFDYAMDPFLRDNSYYTEDFTSRNVAPPQPNGVRVVTESLRSVSLSEDPSFPVPERKDTEVSRNAIEHVRLLLMRCDIAWQMIREAYRKPWKETVDVNDQYYKMMIIAGKALTNTKDIAEESEKNEWQTACYYWEGYAYGGLKLWPEAITAFEQALSLKALSKRNSRSTSIQVEKADIKAALRSVKRRRDIDDAERDKRCGPISSVESSESSEEMVESSESLPWRPDVENILEQCWDSIRRSQSTDFTLEEVYIRHGDQESSRTRGLLLKHAILKNKTS